MMAAANTMNDLVEETFSAYDYRLFVMKRGKEDPMVSQMPEWYVKKIERVVNPEYIDGVSGFLWWMVDNSTSDDDSEYLTMRGLQVDSYKQVIEKYEIVAGEELNNAQKDRNYCMIGINVAEKYEKSVGDAIILQEHAFTIKGIFTTSTMTDSEIWLTIRDAQNLVGKLNKVSLIVVKITDHDYVDEVRKQIEENIRGVVVFEADDRAPVASQARLLRLGGQHRRGDAEFDLYDGGHLHEEEPILVPDCGHAGLGVCTDSCKVDTLLRGHGQIDGGQIGPLPKIVLWRLAKVKADLRRLCTGQFGQLVQDQTLFLFA